MKKFFYTIFLLFSFINIVNGSEIYNYTDWFDYYPTGVEEYRIESEDRYYWYKDITLEDGSASRQTINEYHANMDGYTRIEESKKTFYRVNNGPYIMFLGDNVVYDSYECHKARCRYVEVTPYNPNNSTPPSIDNPKTRDNIKIYLILLLFSIIILLRNNNLVLSNRFKLVRK